MSEPLDGYPTDENEQKYGSGKTKNPQVVIIKQIYYRKWPIRHIYSSEIKQNFVADEYFYYKFELTYGIDDIIVFYRIL